MNIEWALDDVNSSYAEGWGIGMLGDIVALVSKGRTKFPSNAEALAYVVTKSDEGSLFHQRAVAVAMRRRLT